jgi:hypothetical protein
MDLAAIAKYQLIDVDSYESQLLPRSQLRVRHLESYFQGMHQPALEQKRVARKLLGVWLSRLGRPTFLNLKLELRQFSFAPKVAYLLTQQSAPIKGAPLHSILPPKNCNVAATVQSLTHLMTQR